MVRRRGRESGQVFVVGDFGEAGGGEALVVHVAAEMGVPVAYHEVVRTEQAVVARYLADHFLRDGYGRCFVLHDEAGRASLAPVEHGVAAAEVAPGAQADFVGKQGCGVVQVVHEIVSEVLAYPFFRRQGDVASPEKVEYGGVPVSLGGFYFVGWKGE